MFRRRERKMGLLDRCKRGDQAAWSELVDRRSGQIYRWAVLLGLRPSEAEDAAQDVLATAARRIKRCRADEALTSWLYQITRKVVANRRRSSWLRRSVTTATGQVDEEVAFRHVERPTRDIGLELEARRCLRQLPMDLAEVLVMIEVLGHTRPEAARLLGLPEGTVASRQRKAREVFLERWNQDEAGPLGQPLEERT